MSAQAPRVALTPLELLQNDTTREPPFLSKIFGPAFMGTLGFVGVLGANYAARKPVFSGIQMHIGVTLAMAYAGKLVEDWRTRYLAEKDAVYRHYIELHPEEFPPYERVLYRDVFEPWVPIR